MTRYQIKMLLKEIEIKRPELFVMKSATSPLYSNDFKIFAYRNNITDLGKPEQIFGIWDRDKGRIINNTLQNYSDIIDIFQPAITDGISSYNTNCVFPSFIYKNGIDLIFPELISNTRQEFYEKLLPLGKCVICNTQLYRKSNDGFKSCQRRLCSDNCKNKLSSIIMTETNKNMSKELRKQIAKSQSITVKKKIQDGLWTPCVTNSWARSRVKIDNTPFRSSWEAIFYLLNPSVIFEKIRIPYIFNGDNHIYIIDFVDEENRIIYEIKPKGNQIDEKVQIKEKYAIQWAEENNYVFEFISEDYFKENIKDIIVKYRMKKDEIDENSQRLIERMINIWSENGTNFGD